MRLPIPAFALGAVVLFPAASGAQETEPLALRIQQLQTREATCPMPVHVPDQPTRMPLVRPDTTVDARMLVVEPRCHNPLGPLTVTSPVTRLEARRSEGVLNRVRDAFGNWLKPPPADPSKRPPVK